MPVAEIPPMANRSFQSARADIYSRITDDIIAAIENGTGEWQMPWHHDGSSIARPRNIASDKFYRGINVLALWVAAHRARYTSGIWGTYRQWAERGCQVRRGERATSVVFWKQMGRRDDGEPSSDDQDPSHDDRSGRPRFFARGYCVFNEAQVDGHGHVREELTVPGGVRAYRPRRRLLRCAQDPDRHRGQRGLLSPLHRHDLHAAVRALR